METLDDMSATVRYTVYLRENPATSLAILGEFTRVLSIDLNRRFNTFSNAWVEVEANDPVLALVTNLRGIVIERDGQTVYTGIIRGIKDQYEKGSQKVVIESSCDTFLIYGRLGYPVVSGPPYTASAHDVRTGVFETVAKQLVYYNAGAGATTARRITGLTIESDLGRGSSVTSRARFGVLLKLLQTLAKDAIGFKIENMQFKVYTIEDLTSTAVFSLERGNITDYEYYEIRPESNYVIAGGGGEGVARVFAESGDSSSISTYGRIEKFRDARDTSDSGELAQRIAETLAEDAMKYRIKFTPVETEMLKFVTDYDLGDKIMFTRNLSINYSVPITRISIHWDAVTESISTSVSVGTMSPDSDTEDRLSQLESTV